MYTSLSLPKIKKTCELLKNASISYIEKSIPLYAIEADDYKNCNIPPQGEYLPFESVDGKDKRFWIRAEFKTPEFERNSDIFVEVKTGVTGWDGLNPQAIFYANGKMVQGLDINHRLVKLMPDTEYITYNYLYSGREVAHFEVEYDLISIDKETEELYYDMLVPYEACRDVYSEESSEYANLLAILEKCANLIDFRVLRNEDFYKSVKKASEYIKYELYEKLCNTDGKPIVSCIAHTHIDVEWLWDRRQTREKIQRSASTAIALMEDYPEYVFTLSQPELYRYLKEEAPDKFAEMKKKISEGRWEAEGALYLECDCNVTSGESLVRQLMYGKNFFREELDSDSRICLLPDVFGYSASMPQILKKADVDFFVTSKISWNDTNSMPNDMFMWRGIDGTEIFSVFITGQNYKKGSVPDTRTTYNGFITPSFIKGSWERFKNKSYANETLNTYGYGDGGGGPTREMIEYGKRLSKGLPGMPVAKFDTLRSFINKAYADFSKNSEELRRTPRWSGELYLERHRATYTTMGKVKRGNRKSELALTKLESIFAIDTVLGKKYDKSEEIKKLWHIVLHNQFHDILPGSSIESVYNFTDADYKNILDYAEKNTGSELLSLMSRVETDGGLFVYNDTGFARCATYDIGEGYVQSSALIPPFGYAVVEKESPISLVHVNKLSVDSPFYNARFDNSGRIISLYDKISKREIVAEGSLMNEFRVFEDYPNLHDAWEFEEYMEIKPYILDTADSIAPIFDGERAGFEINISYNSSVIREKVWFYSKSPRIDLEMNIDWFEKMNSLKLMFPTSILAEKANCDIQFGHIERQTHRNTDWDKAKFEICAQKWIDISEYGYGISFLSDSKYGYSAEGGKIGLTCLKCPTFPNPEADVGNHVFSYALLPHSGDFCKAGVIREAHSFNRPISVLRVKKQRGDLPSEFSLISADNPAIIIETAKPAEDNRGIIVRLYESFGSTARAKINVPNGFSKATLTNLIERDLEPIDMIDGKIDITAHPFEIITLRFEK